MHGAQSHASDSVTDECIGCLPLALTRLDLSDCRSLTDNALTVSAFSTPSCAVGDALYQVVLYSPSRLTEVGRTRAQAVSGLLSLRQLELSHLINLTGACTAESGRPQRSRERQWSWVCVGTPADPLTCWWNVCVCADAGMHALEPLTLLERLDLRECAVTDVGVCMVLRRMSRLRHLDLSQTQVGCPTTPHRPLLTPIAPEGFLCYPGLNTSFENLPFHRQNSIPLVHDAMPHAVGFHAFADNGQSETIARQCTRITESPH